MDNREIVPTAADMAVDLPAKLAETEEAIATLRSAGVAVPDEAHEIAGFLRRAVYAESKLAKLQ